MKESPSIFSSLMHLAAVLALAISAEPDQRVPLAPAPCSVRVGHIWRVVDGDTVDVVVDVVRVRLLGINAPELHGLDRAKGLASKAWLAAEIPSGLPGTEVLVDGAERDKYGRLLAHIWKGNEDLSAASLAAGQSVVDEPAKEPNP